MPEAGTVMNRAAHRHCSVARALDILGDAWSYLVLRETFFGVRRFDAMQANLGVARNVLSARLASLVDHGLLERRRYQERPPRDEYRLTEMGRDLYPALMEMIRWGDRWRATAAGPPLLFRHAPCGNDFHAEVICSACGEAVPVRDVEYRDGPGAGTDPDPEAVRSARRGTKPEAYERGRACSVARSLMILGDRWSFLILREAFFGGTRFDEFRSGLGIARNILTDRLSRLVLAGVFERRRYQDRPARFEYRFTEMGRDLYGSVLALMAWGDRWLDRGQGRPLVLTHKHCGKEFTPVVACSACHAPLDARDVVYRDGPGARAPKAAD